MKQTLWTKNFTLLTAATVIGAAGGVAGNFALSFLVYDETDSTLAAALLIAINIVPSVLIPLILSPLMDRLPRKPFLVGGDSVNGVLFALAGFYLLQFRFSYVGYLFFSLMLSSLSAFDSLAYQSIYPKLIPSGFEEKGYAVSGMVYPVVQVVMAPVAAVLLDTIGFGDILLVQSVLSLLAALTESRIRIAEVNSMAGKTFSFSLWLSDMKAAASYLRREKGLLNIFSYMAVTNGVAGSYSPILIAFFRTAPGFSVAMYSFFSFAEFSGRTLGGILHYNFKIPPKRRFSFAFLIYQIYELMDMLLLWLPYPLMLVNRAVCGFLGINSAIMRQAAVQRYIPDAYRARLNALNSVLDASVFGILSLIVGAMGEVLDYRVCVTLCGAFASLVCWGTIWRARRAVGNIYHQQCET